VTVSSLFIVSLGRQYLSLDKVSDFLYIFSELFGIFGGSTFIRVDRFKSYDRVESVIGEKWGNLCCLGVSRVGSELG
jgi:hypothetical protein